MLSDKIFLVLSVLLYSRWYSWILKCILKCEEGFGAEASYFCKFSSSTDMTSTFLHCITASFFVILCHCLAPRITASVTRQMISCCRENTIVLAEQHRAALAGVWTCQVLHQWLCYLSCVCVCVCVWMLAHVNKTVSSYLLVSHLSLLRCYRQTAFDFVSQQMQTSTPGSVLSCVPSIAAFTWVKKGVF